MAKNTKTQDTANADADGKSANQENISPNPWTNAFVQVAKYLVADYKDKVTVLPEFELFQKPMRIDAVIIKLEEGLVIDNAVMRSFKRHNIVEFKSPKDTLNIEAFDKTMCYFYAYLSNEKLSKTPSDVAITIVSTRKPRVLAALRNERGYEIINTDTPGIYYIKKDGGLPDVIQLVVSSELPDDRSDQSLLWLRSLRDNLTPEEAAEAVKSVENVDDDDHETILNIVNFILTVNPEILEEVKSMRVDPRVKKFYRDIAIETGVAEEMAVGMAVEMADEMAEERLKTVARNLLLKNMSVEDVQEATGLDIANIVMLQSEIASKR